MKRYFNSELTTHTKLWTTDPKEVHISFCWAAIRISLLLGSVGS